MKRYLLPFVFIATLAAGCDINDLFEQNFDITYQYYRGPIDTLWVENECVADSLIASYLYTIGDINYGDILYSQTYEHSRLALYPKHRGELLTSNDTIYTERIDYYRFAKGEFDPVVDVVSVMRIYPDSLPKGSYYFDGRWRSGSKSQIEIGCTN